MPRPNQPRTIASEKAVARNIARCREANGMSYEGLAGRMEKVGCPINASGIYKIEKAGRRITVDELVAFSQVFGIRVDRLLLPPDVAAREELVSLIVTWDDAATAYLAAEDALRSAWDALHDYVVSHPEVEGEIGAAVDTWAEFYWPDDAETREAESARFLTELRKPRSDADLSSSLSRAEV